MDDELQNTINNISKNLKTVDKTLLSLMFQNHEERLTRLENKLKPSIYNVLNLVIQFLEPLAILILAYMIYKFGVK